jgi:putative hydrolase
MEINAKHPHLDVQEIRTAMKYDVKFIISSDAHIPGRVGAVEAPMQRAREAGVPAERIVNIEETEEE